MRFALLIYADESAVVSQEERSRRRTAYARFEDEMQFLGVLAGSEQLRPAAAARTVRCWDGGDVVVADGPAANTREQVTGFCTVECKDLDEATEIATGIPAAWYGAVEVRPVCGT